MAKHRGAPALMGETLPLIRRPRLRPGRPAFPRLAALSLAALCLGCLLAELMMTHDPAYLDLSHPLQAPGGEFLFGTDSLGRDIFSMIWYGGRVSIFIGLTATTVSTVLAFLYGALSGLAGKWLDALLTRLAELLLSVPSILMVIFLQAVFGGAGALAIALTIGLTSWMSLAKVVRAEVRRLRESPFVQASRCLGGGFFHILRRHLIPNFFPTVLFMVVMNVSGAIIIESTLSFFGLGLPVEIISWGSMLSLAQNSLLQGAWWVALIPGIFLIALILSLTTLAEYLRQPEGMGHSNL